jgi:adenylosuccinate lyase
VGDNTDLIQHREALRLVRSRLVGVVAALADFALRYRDLPTLGFTHFQPAQPTTVGKRATLWIQDLLLDLEEIEFRLRTLRFRGVRGTTGTQASFLDLFEGDGARVEALNRRVAEKMGFAEVYGVTGQTYTRKVDYGCLATLAGVAQSASKFGYDIRLLAHLREVEEPFEEHQIGSSAMAYKRNPMRAERIDALARHAIALVIDPAFTAATQWFERTLDDSANKRIAVPEAYLTVDSILLIQHNVAAGLVVYPRMIRRRLMEELPFMATENLMMRSVKRGGDRQELHERVRQHSVAAGQRIKGEGLPSDLLDRIAADEAFGVTRDELEDALRPELYVGRAPQQVVEFLAEWVEPVLAKYAGDLGTATPELHV